MRITILALSAFALTAGVQASANSIEVRYDDLNLASVSGQKALERRIESAARDVCEVDAQRTGSRILPADVKKRLVDAIAATIKDPQVTPKLLELGFEVVLNTPEQFAAYQAAEYSRWQKLITSRNIKAD